MGFSSDSKIILSRFMLPSDDSRTRPCACPSPPSLTTNVQAPLILVPWTLARASAVPIDSRCLLMTSPGDSFVSGLAWMPKASATTVRPMANSSSMSLDMAPSNHAVGDKHRRYHLAVAGLYRLGIIKVEQLTKRAGVIPFEGQRPLEN